MNLQEWHSPRNEVVPRPSWSRRTGCVRRPTPLGPLGPCCPQGWVLRYRSRKRAVRSSRSSLTSPDGSSDNERIARDSAHPSFRPSASSTNRGLPVAEKYTASANRSVTSTSDISRSSNGVKQEPESKSDADSEEPTLSPRVPSRGVRDTTKEPRPAPATTPPLVGRRPRLSSGRLDDTPTTRRPRASGQCWQSFLRAASTRGCIESRSSAGRPRG